MEYPTREDKKPMHELFFEAQKTIANHAPYIPHYRDFLSSIGREKEEVKIEKLNIAKDETFLGFKSLEYSRNNVFAPKISIEKDEGGRKRPNPLIILIIAPKGAGKSSLMKVIAQDNFRTKFGLGTIIIDPSRNPEWFTSRQPITDILGKEYADKASELYKQFNWMPKGYSGVVYKPEFSNKIKEEGTDKDYMLTLQDFRDIFLPNPTAGEDSLLTMMNQQETNARYIVQSILADKVPGVKIKNFSEVSTLRDNKDFKLKFPDNKAFFGAFEYLMDSGAIGDKAPEEQNILKDIKEKDFVCLRALSKRAEEETTSYSKYQTYLNVWLTKIILDAPKPLQIVSDEIDELAPAKGKSYTRSILEAGGLKERKNDITIIGATQDISLISAKIVQSADIIFFARPQIESDKEQNGTLSYLQKRLPGQVDIIKNLKWQQKNSLGMIVSQWRMVLRDGTSESFYPNLPRSAIKISG